jgi:hypothetical protein
MFQSALGIVQLKQQNPQIQAGFEQIRLKLDGLSVRRDGFLVFVQCSVGIPQVKPSCGQSRLRCNHLFQGVRRSGKVLLA